MSSTSNSSGSIKAATNLQQHFMKESSTAVIPNLVLWPPLRHTLSTRSHFCQLSRTSSTNRASSRVGPVPGCQSFLDAPPFDKSVRDYAPASLNPSALKSSFRLCACQRSTSNSIISSLSYTWTEPSPMVFFSPSSSRRNKCSRRLNFFGGTLCSHTLGTAGHNAVFSMGSPPCPASSRAVEIAASYQVRASLCVIHPLWLSLAQNLDNPSRRFVGSRHHLACALGHSRDCLHRSQYILAPSLSSSHLQTFSISDPSFPRLIAPA